MKQFLLFLMLAGCNQDGGFLWWGGENGEELSESEAMYVLTEECGEKIYAGDVYSCDEDSDGNYSNCKNDPDDYAFLDGYTSIHGDVFLRMDGTLDLDIFKYLSQIRCVDGDMSVMPTATSSNFTEAGLQSLSSLQKITGNFNASAVFLASLTAMQTVGGDFSLEDTSYGLDDVSALERIGGNLTTVGLSDLNGIFGLTYLGKNMDFNVTFIPQCEVDAFAAKMRGLGWDGELISGANNGTGGCE